MPPLDVVVSSDRLFVDTPVLRKEHRTFYPLSSDISHEVLWGLCLCLNFQAKDPVLLFFATFGPCLHMWAFTACCLNVTHVRELCENRSVPRPFLKNLARFILIWPLRPRPHEDYCKRKR